MDDTNNKVYTPEVIPDIPFPGVESSTGETTPGASKNQIYTAPSVPNTNFPTAVIASEVISTSLDSQSKKILANYSFGLSGAISIGKYVAGTSGEIKISPAGLVAKNTAGVNTITIDGETGNATFLGTVAAGSVITGYLAVGQAASDVNGGVTTINGGKINASTQITAGSGNNVGILSGADATYRIWAGNATASSAPFRVDQAGNVTLNSWNLNNGDIIAVSGGIGFKNTKGCYFYNSGNSSLIGSITVDGSNVLSVFNSTGRIELRASSSDVRIIVNGSATAAIFDTSANANFNSVSCGSISSSGITIASGQNIVFAGTQGSINCGNIDCDAIEMNGNTLSGLGKITFSTQGSVPGDSWALYMYNSGGSYSLRTRMNGGNWQVSQSAF